VSTIGCETGYDFWILLRDSFYAEKGHLSISESNLEHGLFQGSGK